MVLLSEGKDLVFLKGSLVYEPCRWEIDQISTIIFGIRGTVAQLDCTIYNVMEDVIDSEHLLVLAQVQRAFVHPNYWDGDKNLFRPQTGLPPYLTFFGSQTFGYVTSDPVSSVCNESPEEGS